MISNSDALVQASHSGIEKNRRAANRMRARVVEITKATPGQSKAEEQEPVATIDDRLIAPPLNMFALATMAETNSELEQNFEAMETNIEETGHRFVVRVKLDDQGTVPDPLKKAVELERVQLENFFTYATEESFREFRKRTRRDLESTGNRYFEVIRDMSGAIQGFNHIPSYQMYMSKVENEPYQVDQKILQMLPDGQVVVKTIKRWKRFRVYAQTNYAVCRGAQVTLQRPGAIRWFKHFGDPRVYDNRTGRLAEDPAALEEKHRANEIIHDKLYSPRSPYGLPRTVGNLLSIYGDRAAEEINYITFRNNNIPSMVVAVSNGQLTDDSVSRIQEFVDSQIQGGDNYSKFLVLEAETTGDDGEDGGHIRIDIKPLTSEQHKDALFQNYSSNNQDKIRRAFRLPPIFVGRSDDYTRATAEASRKLADEQIFAPERERFDDILNRFIFPDMGIVYHKYRSNTPTTTDNEQLVRILANAEKTGGMTPRIARKIIGEVLSMEMPEFPKNFDPDVPFSLTMAEAVKNMADAAEPGQQVTAMKWLTKALATVDEADSAPDEFVDRLLSLRKKVDKLWRERGIGLAD